MRQCRVNNIPTEQIYETGCMTSYFLRHLWPFTTSVSVAPQIVARSKANRMHSSGTVRHNESGGASNVALLVAETGDQER
jgi:hypothetical protein